VAADVSGHDPVLGSELGRVRHRGHFPNEQAALKVLYLVAVQRRPNRENLTGRINGWKHILNALTIHYGDRIDAASYR
jgi:putative transposase